jgi:predicted RNase H-like HicB family nuclease/predicted transcriptional regulator
MKYYPALIRKEPDSDYGVEFPDFPGCVSAGATAVEALANATQALQLHVEGMRDDGEAIPEPSDLAAVLATDGAVDAGATLVPLVGAKGRAVRFNATMDEFLLERVDIAAQEFGMTRSALLATAVRQYIDGRADPLLAAMEDAVEQGLRPFDAIERAGAEEEKQMLRERHPPDISKTGKPGYSKQETTTE